RQDRRAVPVGVALSGGLDSRCFAGVAARQTKKLPVFTFGVPTSMERRLAHQVAQALEADEYTVDPKDLSDWNWMTHFDSFCRSMDGTISVLHGHEGLLLNSMSSACGVVLDGLTGGVFFGDHLLPKTLNQPISENPGHTFLKKFNAAFSPEELLKLLPDGACKNSVGNLADGFQQRITKTKTNNLSNLCDYVDWRERQRRFILNGNQLLRTAVEVRVPFYDNDLLDFALTLPESVRINITLFREAVVDLIPNLAHIKRTPYEDEILYTPPAQPSLWRMLRCPELLLRKRKKHWRPLQALIRAYALPFLGRAPALDYRAILLQDRELRAYLENAYPPGNPWFSATAIPDLFSRISQSPGKAGVSAMYRLFTLLTLALYRKQIGWD
ncbi:TPA: hypothetical protein DDW35_11125, partial [Candidatus Sumerlaeota bacterium]|nr:hypothetical protein [Candidatus Sumerlaeota bacterium]